MTRRKGFTLVEVIVALVILSGVLLAMTDFTRQFTRQTSDSAVTAKASDIAVQQLETVKAWRTYSTLVSAFHNSVLTYAVGGPYAGLRRETLAVRTGPNTTADFVTVTVIVSGGGLPSPLRRTTIIAAF
jgi:prepilin-type N-terminal cleavage/methylation domain-containing protein